MDGENNGNPYEQMDDLGGKIPLFLVQHPYTTWPFSTKWSTFNGWTNTWGWCCASGAAVGRFPLDASGTSTLRFGSKLHGVRPEKHRKSRGWRWRFMKFPMFSQEFSMFSWNEFKKTPNHWIERSIKRTDPNGFAQSIMIFWMLIYIYIIIYIYIFPFQAENYPKLIIFRWISRFTSSL